MRNILVVLTILPLFANAVEHLPAKKGEVKIDGQSVQEVVGIDGEFEFYWNQLLTPTDFPKGDRHFEIVPSKWNNYLLNDQRLPSRGYATYRLTILNPEKLSDLMIKIPGIATASRIFVNDRLAVAMGNVATSAEQSVPKRLHHFISLPDSEIIYLVIQVSNYEYSIPGLAHTLLVGHEKDILAKERLENDFEMIEIGFLLLMIFYHLALYFQWTRNISYLLLSFLGCIVLVRATSTYHSSLLLYRLFPSLDFSLIKTIEFSFTYAASFVLPMFIRSLFPSESSKWMVRVFQITGGLLVLICLFTPPYIFGELLNVFHVLMTIAFLFVLKTLYHAIRNKREGAWWIFAGLLICSVFVEFEILMIAEIIPEKSFPFPNPVGIGVVIFLLCQSLALSVRFTRAFHTVEDLTHTLENRVEKRTEELSRANLVKDKLFSIVSHDLRSPLQSLRGLLDLTDKQNMTQEELKLLLPSIRQQLNHSMQLLDNLLSWASSQMKGLKTRKEPVRLAAVVDENINLFRVAAKNKALKVTSKVESHVTLDADLQSTKLIMRNLLSNAIKFTPNGGSVEIAAVAKDAAFEITVTDSGVGMTTDFQERLFQLDMNRSTRGTENEKGTGIGLLLCREFIEKNGGRLWVESSPGQGSKFSFTLPAAVPHSVKEVA